MKLQVCGLAVFLLTIFVTAEPASNQPGPGGQQHEAQPDETHTFLKELTENGKRLANQAFNTVLELLSDSNKKKLKHVAKDLWNKAEEALKDILKD